MAVKCLRSCIGFVYASVILRGAFVHQLGWGGRMLCAGPVLVWECQHGRRRRRRSARYPVNNACLTVEAMLPG